MEQEPLSLEDHYREVLDWSPDWETASGGETDGPRRVITCYTPDRQSGTLIVSEMLAGDTFVASAPLHGAPDAGEVVR